MQEPQQYKYLASILTHSKQLVATTYAKSPLKAPVFIERAVLLVDSIATPYLDSVTNLVDTNITKSVDIVHSYESKLGLTEQGLKLKQKGKELKDSLKDQSKKAIDHGMDLAVNNTAAQYVINTGDRVANTVFTSIENRVQYLQKRILKQDKEQNKDTTTYHKRVVSLASDITSLSSGLVNLLKTELTHITQGTLVSVRTITVTHLKATYSTLTIVLFTPIQPLYTTSKTQLIDLLTLLKTKYNQKELTHYLYSSLLNLHLYLSKEEISNFAKLLIKTLRELSIIEITKNQLKYIKTTYIDQLNKKEEKQEQQLELSSNVESKPTAAEQITSDEGQSN